MTQRTHAWTLAAPCLVALACSSCSSSRSAGGRAAGAPPPAPLPTLANGTYQSGTLLRARLLKGDGAALFAGWHDGNGGIDCGFLLGDDGVWRCMPTPEGSEAFTTE